MKLNRYAFLAVWALILAGSVRAQSISNFSMLVTIPSGGTCTVGFVVPGTIATPLLLRAVGGKLLQQFGISNPVAAPDMQLVNSKGVSFGFGTVGIGPNFPALYASVGAFPLAGGSYYATCGSFVPGTYTVQISDDSGRGGNVLFEVYLVSPSNPALGGPLPITVTPVSPVTTPGPLPAG